MIKGTKSEQVRQICEDIADFKKTSGVEHVLVMWTANTERFCSIAKDLNDTPDNLRKAIEGDHIDISPSTLFAYAAITMKVGTSTSSRNVARKILPVPAYNYRIKFIWSFRFVTASLCGYVSNWG